MPRYGRKAQSKVKRAMHEMKRGELKSGRSGKKVTSRKQAIAIGLSEARREGARVPNKPGSSSAGRRKASRRRSPRAPRSR
ncbi:MAG TPA: DUF6496 domain-containing protein [Candidatus Krumholzibacteria bacterium]|nr:DUF6496 domain-containing protein [Candidatus Krumholzibacteria bacterium]